MGNIQKLPKESKGNIPESGSNTDNFLYIDSGAHINKIEDIIITKDGNRLATLD